MSTVDAPSIPFFTSSADSFDAHPHVAATKIVYRAGEGPAIIVITEMPGITPEVADFAQRLVSRGFSVALPSLFGTPGKSLTGGYAASTMAKACVSKEFHTMATGATSPVVGWLRKLAEHEHERCGGPGVGVIGMCFTGGFALGMMVDDIVVAPVLSQPSLPFAIGKARRRDLGLSAKDLEIVAERVGDGCSVLGLRFTNDKLSPSDRFERLRDELGDGFIGVEIDSSKDNEHGIAIGAHSVVTNDLVDEPGHPTRAALDQVMDFFAERLQPNG